MRGLVGEHEDRSRLWWNCNSSLMVSLSMHKVPLYRTNNIPFAAARRLVQHSWNDVGMKEV